MDSMDVIYGNRDMEIELWTECMDRREVKHVEFNENFTWLRSYRDSNYSVLTKCEVRTLNINKEIGRLTSYLLVAMSDGGFSSQFGAQRGAANIVQELRVIYLLEMTKVRLHQSQLTLTIS